MMKLKLKIVDKYGNEKFANVFYILLNPFMWLLLLLLLLLLRYQNLQHITVLHKLLKAIQILRNLSLVVSQQSTFYGKDK